MMEMRIFHDGKKMFSLIFYHTETEDIECTNVDLERKERKNFSLQFTVRF